MEDQPGDTAVAMQAQARIWTLDMKSLMASLAAASEQDYKLALSKRSAGGNNKEDVKICNCDPDLTKWTLAKHVGSCCPDCRDVDHWMSGDGPSERMPPMAGVSGINMTDFLIFPNLVITIEHMVRALYGPDWEALAPLRMLQPGAPSKQIMLTMRYRPSKASRIAPFALPSTVSRDVTRSVGSIEIYGIATEFDSMFMKTPMGTMHAIASLQQMAMGFVVNRNFNTAIVYARVGRQNCLHTPDTQMSKIMIDEYTHHKMQTYALAQRADSHGFMASERYMADKLIFQNADFDDASYVIIAPHEVVTAYARMNPAAVKMSQVGGAGPAQFFASKHLGSMEIFGRKVLSMSPFRMPPNVLVQPLERTIEIGEFACMYQSADAYIPHSADIKMFTAKGFETIEFLDAIQRMQIWTENGAPFVWSNPRIKAADFPQVANTVGFPYKVSGSASIEPMNFLDIINYQAETHPSAKINYLRQLKSIKEDQWKAVLGPTATVPTNFEATLGAVAFTRDNCKSWCSAGIPLPFNIVVNQPHKRYQAVDCLGTIPGRVLEALECLGAATVTDSPNGKRYIVAEKRMGNIVFNVRNVTAVESVFITRGFNETDSVEPLQWRAYDPIHYNFVGSSIYAPVPWWWRAPQETLCLVPDMSNLSDTFADEDSTFVQNHSYPSAMIYDQIFGWNKRGISKMAARHDNMPYTEMTHCPVNMFSRMACYLRRSPEQVPGALGPFNVVVHGNGYWGYSGTYEGAEQQRIGKIFHANPDRGVVVHDSGR